MEDLIDSDSVPSLLELSKQEAQQIARVLLQEDFILKSELNTDLLLTLTVHLFKIASRRFNHAEIAKFEQEIAERQAALSKLKGEA